MGEKYSTPICPFLTEYLGNEGQNKDLRALLGMINSFKNHKAEIEMEFMQKTKFQDVT